MTREIKFTPFGIPYILEFENVSFIPEGRRKTSTHSPQLESESESESESFCYIDSPPPTPPPSFSLRSVSSIFKRKPTQHSPPRHDTHLDNTRRASSEVTKPLPCPPQSDVSETHGIYIQFPAGHSCPQTTRRERLVQLQQTISVAVLDAGMSRSPGNTARPEKHPNGNAVHGGRGNRTPDALFCGTYGQMMAALHGAGLSTTPLPGQDLLGHTRLGALFVARNDGGNGVQLRKITLWG